MPPIINKGFIEENAVQNDKENKEEIGSQIKDVSYTDQYDDQGMIYTINTLYLSYLCTKY